MTCIIGICENSKVYLGADSRALAGYHQTLVKQPKIFKLGQFLIGVSGYPRLNQLIQYGVEFRQQNIGESDMSYLVNVFVSGIQGCIKTNDFMDIKDGVSAMPESSILFGYKNNLYGIDSNFQITQSTDNYQAIGSGADYALGVMKFTDKWKLHPHDRIKKALEVSAYFDAGVSKPFRIMSI